MDLPVKKSILILSATPASLIPAENFLVNRDWTVHSTTDMKAALTYIVQERPQFVMVSVEHADKKILGLPRLLKQTYPDLCVIVFAESTSLDSYRLLAQAGGAYRVHPPITGPAIERAVHKYVRELNEKKQAENLLELTKRRNQAKHEAELSRVAWQVHGGKAGADKNLLSKVTGKALEQIVDRGDGKVRRPIEGPTTNVACIVLESEQFSGYLIAATGGDDPLDPRFVATIRERLCKFLRDNGQDVRDRVSFPLKIREVPFETWALDYAEFMKKTVHRGQELAFAFFPVAEVSPMIFGSDKAEMAQVRLQDIDTEKPLPFDVHLFLPANQRHILYTAKNGRFYPEQKKRLQDAGVEHLHIKKGEAEAFLRYRAELNVESLLERFVKDRPPEAV